MAKSDLQLMREKINRHNGWTEQEIEHEYLIRELTKPPRYVDRMFLLIKEMQERAELLKKVREIDDDNS